jgi:hypothetical protein
MAKEMWFHCPVLFHTVELVRGWIEQNRFLPKICPCCERKVKRYKNPLTSGYAIWLISLVKMYMKKERYYHVREFGLTIAPEMHDMGKARHWKLCEQEPNKDDPTKKCSGMWRPTQLGIDFVFRNEMIPEYEIRENQEVLFFEGDMVNIDYCLGENFNYEKLMCDYKEEEG